MVRKCEGNQYLAWKRCRIILRIHHENWNSPWALGWLFLSSELGHKPVVTDQGWTKPLIPQMKVNKALGSIKIRLRKKFFITFWKGRIQGEWPMDIGLRRVSEVLSPHSRPKGRLLDLCPFSVIYNFHLLDKQHLRNQASRKTIEQVLGARKTISTRNNRNLIIQLKKKKSSQGTFLLGQQN